MQLKQSINSFVEDIVKAAEQDFQSKVQRADLQPQLYLDMLYKIRDTMTYEETLEEVFTFLGAGFDTTGKALPGALLLLAMNPDAQEKVLEELNDIFDSDDAEVDEECLNKMK